MTVRLQDLLADQRLRPHRTSAKEIADLLKVADRDLADAEVTRISADRRFATAYNAALAFATVALYAGGYSATGAGHHWATFQALPAIMGPQMQARADYLDNCRAKRNVTDYDRAGTVSQAEVREILAEARAFRSELLKWLRANHPDLVPKARR